MSSDIACRKLHTKVSVVSQILSSHVLIHSSAMKPAQNVRAVCGRKGGVVVTETRSTSYYATRMPSRRREPGSQERRAANTFLLLLALTPRMTSQGCPLERRVASSC